MRKIIAIAHRGDSSRALENSLEAVRLALAVPVDMIEVDIRKSRDNRLYVMHDKDTGRTADAPIDIEQSTTEEIALVRLKNGEPIPTLGDVLKEVAGKAGLNFEIKSDGAGGLCAAHILGSGYKGPVLVSSFKEREVTEVRRIMPSAHTAQIFEELTPQELNGYKAKGYNIVSVKKKAVTEELIAACRAKKIKVYVWTVDEEDDMRKFAASGVDGIYTNKPVLLKSLLGSRS